MNSTRAPHLSVSFASGEAAPSSTSSLVVHRQFLAPEANQADPLNNPEKNHAMTSAPTQYVSLPQLSSKTGIPASMLRNLYKKKRISVVRLGHRTLVFNLQQVLTELEGFHEKALPPPVIGVKQSAGFVA